VTWYNSSPCDDKAAADCQVKCPESSDVRGADQRNSGCHSTGQPVAGPAAARRAEFEAVLVWQLRIERVHHRRSVASSKANSLTLAAVAPWFPLVTHRPGTIAGNT